MRTFSEPMALLAIVALITAIVAAPVANGAPSGRKPPPKYKTTVQAKVLKKRTETALEGKMKRALRNVNDIVSQAKNPALAGDPATQRAIDTRARQYNTSVRNLNRVRNQSLRQYARGRNIWIEPTNAPPILPPPAPPQSAPPPLPSGSPPSAAAAASNSSALQPPEAKRPTTRRDAGHFQRISIDSSSG